MRIIAILSPTGKYGTKASYSNLRKFLVSDGYIRIAPEVFMRITPTRKTAEKHLDRIKAYAPSTGVVRVIKLTEKQYSKIMWLTGTPDYQENTVGANVNIM